MKIYQCGYCNHPLYFENISCEKCGHLCGYYDLNRQMLTFNRNETSLVSDREQIEFKYCKNKEHHVCNWLLLKTSSHEYCAACQLNRTIPDLYDIKNYNNWQHLEIAKHRLIYQLQKIGLNLRSKTIDVNGFCFDFITKDNSEDIMTGHANGVITILLQEADSVFREKTRKELDEPYRTLIGHLRHEIGHYFWEQLVRDYPDTLYNFRNLFGNEQANYSKSLENYYKYGAPRYWRTNFISKYATSHPWEDWAETWAHYLHIMDIAETAHFIGLEVNNTGVANNLNIQASFDPYFETNFDAIVETCVPLSYAVNSINRAMGIPDVYPFVISAAVVQKMKFIHQLLLGKRNFYRASL